MYRTCFVYACVKRNLNLKVPSHLQLGGYSSFSVINLCLPNALCLLDKTRPHSGQGPPTQQTRPAHTVAKTRPHCDGSADSTYLTLGTLKRQCEDQCVQFTPDCCIRAKKLITEQSQLLSIHSDRRYRGEQGDEGKAMAALQRCHGPLV